MSVGIVGGIANVVRMELGRADQLGAMIRTSAPEVTEVLRPMVPDALRTARGAVSMLRDPAVVPQSVHVEIGVGRVLKQIDGMIAEVAQGGLPRQDRLRFALQHLSHIPGA